VTPGPGLGADPKTSGLKKARSLGMQERFQYLLEMESKQQGGGTGGPSSPQPYPP